MIYLYCFMILGIIGFQIALIRGAPWGNLTQGGKVDGALPVSGRIVAAISILVLIGLALAMLSADWVWPRWPSWTGWIAVGVNAVMMVLNWITPSAAERKLWGSITTVLFVLAAMIVWL